MSVAQSPNVIIIMCDDLGYGDLSSHGHPYIQTPHLDAFRQSGISLSNYHATPVCTPSRSELMSGVAAMHTGAFSAHGQHFLLPVDYKIMPEYFKASHYNTALYGKWHLGGNFPRYRPHERGFDDAVHFLRGGHWSHPNPWNSDCMDDIYYHNGVREQYTGYAADIWFDLSRQFVRKSKAESKPFFLNIPVHIPHIPHLVPERYKKRFSQYPELDQTAINFYAMVECLDEHIGSFVAFLKAEGVWEDTLFIFTSDHGSTLWDQEYNAGMRGKKASLYEGGHRVAFFLNWPNGNLRNGVELPELVQITDVLPTLIELCDLDPAGSDNLPGTGFAPLLREGSQPALDDRTLVVQWQEPKGKACVIHRNWRLVNNEELYDINADRAQEVDIAPQHPDIVQRLRQHYEQWWQAAEPALMPAPYYIGFNDEEIQLTAYDWYWGERVFNWPHLRAGEKKNGKYRLQVVEGGRYQVALRRWPREANAGICESVPAYTPFDPSLGDLPEGVALDIVNSRIQWGDTIQEAEVAADAQEVIFELDVSLGEQYLQTWFIDRNQEAFGAYYVYLTKLR